VPRGLHLPWRLIIRRFELSDKTYSKTNFEPAIRGSARRASGLVLVGKTEVIQKRASGLSRRLKDHTERRGEEAASMAHRKTSKRSKTRSMLRLADLEQSKIAVLHSLGAASSQESYGHAIDEFIGWYCSEPRLAFNRTVVLWYRFFLEQKNLAPSTINVRLAAVRRLAYEASDTGLLSPDLAAGIRRVKGAKRLGARIGNWLTADQSRTLLGEPPSVSLRSKRDRAILALLIGCGLRRAELVGLGTEDFQIREERCVIADLVGKGKHIRTVPVPLWAKRAVDEWITAAGINGGAIFRRVSRLDKIWGDGITPKAISHVVKAAPSVLTSRIWLLTTCVAPVLGSAISQAENLSKFSFYLDMHRFKQPRGISAASRNSAKP
jgi:integrase